MGRYYPMDSDNSAVHIAREEQTMSDECEECKLYGDDYRWDTDEQDYVSNCEDCIFNEYRGEYDDE